MAEGILFDIAKNLLESLGKSAFQEVSSWWGTRSDLKKLEQTLMTIKARVIDAEKRHEEERSAVIKEWLRRLRAVFFKADDLFDDVFTAQQRKRRIKGNLAMKVRLLFSDSSPLLFSIKVAREIKSIRQELDAIKSDMDGLNLSNCDHRDDFHLPFANLMSKRETTSFVQPDDIIGRHDDKNEIISMLFDPVFTEERVSVIPIVGFGGIGKTTLAQLVFNDEKVKTHFDLMKWACVPEVDNQNEVMRKICNSLTGLNCHGLSLEQVQSKIQKSISNKRYLLVLDDIWDESRDRWLKLKSLLDCGSKGSKIIVTTRSNVVANVVGTCPAYVLGLLTDEESWELFKRFALKEGQEESSPSFTRIGKDIVGRCGRVPLAIRVIGSLLYSKDTEQEWLLFCDDRLAKIKVTEDDNIMPVLKLSYDFLPSPLKQCFAYCSLFHKDYEFEKNELVHLWMAQGYIEPSEESISLEEVGDIYFLELLRRNFFQDAKEVDGTNEVYCKMHDLMHDLALHVAGEEDELEVKTTSCYTREDRFLVKKTMRTCLYPHKLVLTRMISRLESLRALKFVDFGKTLPDCIGRLRHLRYLNLRYSSIKSLPDSITKLENLQTLNLDSCYSLRQLPNGFTKLANLRHLVVPENHYFREMPSGFEKMRSLRELNIFMVGKYNGVDALATLELRGNLEIRFNRWRRNTVLEARRVELGRQTQLTGLTLDFQDGEYDVTPTCNDKEELFECLMLPPNLRSLKVRQFMGERFPIKMVEGLLCLLPRLVHVTIECCIYCRQIPRFSNLPHLKSLSLEYISVEYIEECCCDDDAEPCSATYFPVLEYLCLSSLSELKGWWSRRRVMNEIQARQGEMIISENHQNLTSQQLPLILFSCLSRVRICDCLQLMSIPVILPRVEYLSLDVIDEKLLEFLLTSHQEAPSPSSSSSTNLSTLKTLEIHRIYNLVSFSINFCSLESLSIRSCKELTNLIVVSPSSSIRALNIYECDSLRHVYDVLQHLPALEKLSISNCEELDLWDTRTWPELRSLYFLEVSNISKLQLFPKAIGSLQALRELKVESLKNLTSLPEEIGRLSQLQRLDIYECPKLASLPQSLRSLSSLQELTISLCSPQLGKRCREPNGEDWPLIQHIPYRTFIGL